MTRVIKDKNCGNSPKNELIQAFCIAAARKDLELIEDLVTDDVDWHSVGRKPVVGSKRRAFCHVFEFRNARGDRIRSIKTFSVPVS